MARKKSRSRAKSSSKNGKLSPEILREITAIALVAVVFLLVVGFMGAGGGLTDSLIATLSLVVGNLVYLGVVIMLFVAYRLFTADPKKPAINWWGLILLIVALAGLFHVGAPEEQSLVLAQDGGGGGLIGYLVSRTILNLLSPISAGILLSAAALIGFVMSLNVRPSEAVRKLAGWWRTRPEGSDLVGKLEGKPLKDSLKINAKVPLASNQGDRDEPEEVEEAEALISHTDPDWKLPSIDLLDEKTGKADAGNPKQNAEIIEQTLASFGIKVKMEEINIGPTVTQYTLRPESNVKLSKITELSNNLELNLAAHPIRLEAPIPGKSAVGIEVPNRKVATVYLREIFGSETWKGQKGGLTFALGRDISGQVSVNSIDSMPHLLIAGATGSGKSIMINSLLMSLLFRHSPSDLKLILIDPKRVELKPYDGIPHLLAPVVVEPEKAISSLKWAVAEMERRYSAFSDVGNRNIGEYNKSNKDSRMPYIVIIIDELADLMMMAPHDVESLVVRIAQKARATGIHLVIATQRPSVNVITGLIKANITARIAFSTFSQVDSRTIIDQAGAEKLLGKGDMLFLGPEHIKPRRIQGVFVSEKETKRVIDYLREARSPQYNDDVLNQTVNLGSGRGSVAGLDDVEDGLIMEAARLVIESRKASASLLQRRLRIGYARAARLLDMLEERGIVSAPDGSRPRDILVDSVGEVMGSSADDNLEE